MKLGQTVKVRRFTTAAPPPHATINGLKPVDNVASRVVEEEGTIVSILLGDRFLIRLGDGSHVIRRKGEFTE